MLLPGGSLSSHITSVETRGHSPVPVVAAFTLSAPQKSSSGHAAIEYIEDRVAALSELRRVLRPDGALVLSGQHPTGDWLRHGGSHFHAGPSRRRGARAGGCSTGWRCWSENLQGDLRRGLLFERLLRPYPVPEARGHRHRRVRTACPRPQGTHRAPAPATFIRKHAHGGMTGR